MFITETRAEQFQTKEIRSIYNGMKKLVTDFSTESGSLKI